MKPATKAQKEWMERVRRLGCRVCRNLNLGDTPAAIHHCLTGAGGRKDHWKVLPLCHYHHQGEQGIHTLGRKVWQAKYGTEEQLMQQVREELSFVNQ
jgi:hypothetical protein